MLWKPSITTVLRKTIVLLVLRASFMLRKLREDNERLCNQISHSSLDTAETNVLVEISNLEDSEQPPEPL